MILLPWERQPNELARINKNHPLAANLVFAALPGGPELIRNVPVSLMNNGGQSTTLFGRSFYSPGTSSDGLYWALPPDHPLYSITTQDTILVLTNRIAGSAYNNLFGVPYRSGSWSSPYFAWAMTSDAGGDWGVVGVAPNSGTWNTVDSNGTYYQNNTPQAYGSIRNGSNVKFMRGLGQFGSDRTMTSSSPDWTNKQPATLFNNSKDAPAGQMQAHGSLILVWNRSLAIPEWTRIVSNPWQLFEPKRIYVKAAGASGAGTGTSSFSFAATGTGASTAASAGSATVTFGVTGTGTGTFATSGSATVTFTPSAVGTAVSQGAGTATLTFTVSGVGTSTTSGEGAGTADVTFAASAVGTSTAAAAGTATVTFNASGVGPTVSTGVGTASFAFDATAYAPTVATGVGSATFTFSAFGSSVDFRYPAIVELTDEHVTKLALNDLPLTLVELTDSATYKVTLSDIGNVS